MASPGSAETKAVAPHTAVAERISNLLRHSRWLSSRVALGVTTGLFVAALLAGTLASWQARTADSLVAEQGWLRLTKARLDALAAAEQTETDLAAGVTPADASATFAAARTRIESSLAGLDVTGELARSTSSTRRILKAVPAGPTTAERLQVATNLVVAEIGAAANSTPLSGDLAFGDTVVAEIARLQLATRLVAVVASEGPAAAEAGVGANVALELATEVTRDADDLVWRFGTATMAADVPERWQADLTALTTSEQARIVQEATRWAAAEAGIGDGTATTPPDVGAAAAAADHLSTSLTSMGTSTLSAQAADLAAGERSARGWNLKFMYAVIACLASATIILLLRRNRSRINDDQLRVAASTDRLTGLGNRAHLDEQVALLSERSPEVVLMHIDLDHFKPVNDTYGHAVGDRVLQLSAERLREVADTHEGIAARLGGDEFVLVLPSIEPTVVDEITDSLLDHLKSFRIGGLDLTVGASIGVARGCGEVTDLLINADLALYQAKRTGRGQASTFRAEAAAFVSFVRDALMDGRVQVMYQPQVTLRDGRCVGAEVLGRLVDENGTMIAAKEWLGIAEWLGVTGELFEHVVSAVCNDLRNGPPLQTQLWFNVAPNDLIRPGGPEWVLQQLSRLKLPVSMLGIELTETEAITDPARLAVVLERLRAVGLGLALDDFGARNTPLGHLVDLPVTRVKLDSSLIEGIGEDMPPSSWVVRAMAELANRLRIEVLAEGVTSGHQMALLAKLGVPAAQGYLLGLPGPIERLPTHVDIRSLLQTSLRSFAPSGGVGPLVQDRTQRTPVERSPVDRRMQPSRRSN